MKGSVLQGSPTHTPLLQICRPQAQAVICASGPLARDRRFPWPLLVLELVTRAAYRTQRNISLGRSPVYYERMWLKNSTGQRTGEGCRSFHTLSLHRPGGTHNLVLLWFYGGLITEGYSSWGHKELDMTEHTHTRTHTHTSTHMHICIAYTWLIKSSATGGGTQPPGEGLKVQLSNHKVYSPGSPAPPP